MLNNDDFITRISKQVEQRIANENKNKEILEGKKSMPDKESGIEKTGKNNLKKLDNVELQTTPLEVLQEQSMSLQKEILQSTNSIDSTVSDLRSYMKDMFANRPDPSVQRIDIYSVETAVGCARTINELLKTKLEAIKIAKDVVR